MPQTRAAAKRSFQDKGVAYVTSDPESESEAKHIKKRKTEHNDCAADTPQPLVKGSKSRMLDDAMDIDEWSLPQPQIPQATACHMTTTVSASPTPKLRAKNAHLKGRKRFMADLEDMKLESEDAAIEMYGLQVKSVRSGDEEGSIELKILREGQHLIALNLLIDDTAAYPREHTFYSFAQDAEIPPHILKVVEKVSSTPPKPLADTVASLLASVAASFSQGKYVPQENGDIPEEAQDYEDESDDAGAYDDDADYHFGLLPAESHSIQLPTLLRSQFLSVIKAGFKPGLTRLNDSEIVLSISCPVPSLSIPPRALVAWDRRLLLSYHNLTLLISGFRGSYPIISSDGSFTTGNAHTRLRFHVGLSPRYKPSKEVVLENMRNFGLRNVGVDPDPQKLSISSLGDLRPSAVNTDPGRFEKFSLSSSLESLMSSKFLDIVQLRVRFKLGWAGAELLLAGAIQFQRKPEALFGPHEKAIRFADATEAQLQTTYSLPADPLIGEPTEELNLPLLAYCYLVRRFTLCSRFCLVCHNRIKTKNSEALKPYVCDSKLCAYQYYALNFGSSIEYEICTNPQAVDLLLSLAYASAREHQLCENLPVGLGLRVPVPKALPPVPQNRFGVAVHVTEEEKPIPSTAKDGLCDFDELSLPLMRAAITEMIDSLPSITDMKAYLEHRVLGKVSPQLKTMDENILPAAWTILRWCVASSTAYLEHISDEDELIPNIEPEWRQFRFSVGAPDKETRFKTCLDGIQKVNENARKYPAIYGFHGSSLKNWHSIIRQGLLIKKAVNGRAYGDGVYFSKEGAVSLGTYAGAGMSRWENSEIKPLACAALAEIVNSPNDFQSKQPYYVVQHVDWIMCRYLLVKSDASYTPDSRTLTTRGDEERRATEYVALDPKQQLTMNQKQIIIPEQSHKLRMLLEARKAEIPQQDLYDEEDDGVLNGTLFYASGPDTQFHLQSKGLIVQREAADDWQHNEEWCNEETYVLLPPPAESTSRAVSVLQKELRGMLKEQEKAVKVNGLKELGWYLPPQLMGDNLFRWMLELHSFDPALPIAQDMAKHNVPSILFEVRFPASFPNQPPFFRIIKPRFLPFIAGGGGHVTGGGSICMDLLVSDGWLPSYSISAILLQIKLAISNLDPRPARLAQNWNIPYSAAEALEGFKRAARTHGWKVPDGLEKLVP